MCSTRAVGAYQASRAHAYAWDRGYKNDATQRGIVFCAGGGGDELWYKTVTALPASAALPKTLTGNGLPIASFESEFTWGNTTSQTRVTDLRTYAQSTLGFQTGKVHLLGVSMGGLIALNWAKANPTLVQSIGLVIPAIDVQEIYTNNLGGYQASVSTAWGGAPADANNPAKNAASFTGIPIKIWYSTTDPICTPTAATTFASAVGAATQSLGAIGHDASTLVASQVADFFQTH